MAQAVAGQPALAGQHGAVGRHRHVAQARAAAGDLGKSQPGQGVLVQPAGAGKVHFHAVRKRKIHRRAQHLGQLLGGQAHAFAGRLRRVAGRDQPAASQVPDAQAMGKFHGSTIIFIQAAERRVQTHVQAGGQRVLNAVHGVGVTVHAHQLVVHGLVGRIERNLHCVQAGSAQVLAQGAGQHAAVGVQPRYKPLRSLHQLDQILAQRRLAAGKSQLRYADAAAFFNHRQPLVGVHFGHGGKGLVGGVAVQTFLIAMPGVVLYHRGDHQVHAVWRGHAGGVLGQRDRLDVQRRLLAPRHGDEGIQHHLQIRFDLQRLGLTINFTGSCHRLGVDGRPVGVL